MISVTWLSAGWGHTYSLGRDWLSLYLNISKDANEAYPVFLLIKSQEHKNRSKHNVYTCLYIKLFVVKELLQKYHFTFCYVLGKQQ